MYFVDDGYSGTNFNRPDWQRLIGMINEDKIGIIIVKDMSRFGRDYLQVGMYTEMLFPAQSDGHSPYGWDDTTITRIFTRQEYLGHTVNFKTRTKSFRDKKKLANDPSEWVIFVNTHEAIIDQESFDIVQRIREGRRRVTPMGEMPILSGILFCADCGSKLYQVRHRGWMHEQEIFVCAKYRKHKGMWTPSSVWCVSTRT